MFGFHITDDVRKFRPSPYSRAHDFYQFVPGGHFSEVEGRHLANDVLFFVLGAHFLEMYPPAVSYAVRRLGIIIVELIDVPDENLLQGRWFGAEGVITEFSRMLRENRVRIAHAENLQQCESVEIISQYGEIQCPQIAMFSNGMCSSHAGVIGRKDRFLFGEYL